MTATNFAIKATGKNRALYQVSGRVDRFVKVFGRILAEVPGNKMHPDTNALLLKHGQVFVAQDNETCAEALCRYLALRAEQA